MELANSNERGRLPGGCPSPRWAPLLRSYRRDRSPASTRKDVNAACLRSRLGSSAHSMRYVQDRCLAAPSSTAWANCSADLGRTSACAMISTCWVTRVINSGWDHLERRNAGGLTSSGDRAASAGVAGLPDLVEVTQASCNCRKMRSGEQNEKCAVASTCRNHPRRGKEPDPGEQIVQYTRAVTSKPFHRLPTRGCAALPRKGMGRLWPGWRNFLGRPRQMWMSPVQRGMQCLPGED
jgi:hypothetical protein